MEPFESAALPGEEKTDEKKKKKKDDPFEPKGLAGSIYVMLHDMVSILAVIVVGFVFLARLVGVSGSSMYPTLVGAQDYSDAKGDYLILRSNFIRSTYEQGDIVVACVPTFQEGKPIVKRVVAVGGQTVSFRAGEDGHLHVWVDDIELKMPPPQYTIKTLDALRQREPENDFTFVMGADNLENIHRWRDFQRILSDYGVAVYPRKGYDHEAIRRQLIEDCRHFPAPYVLDANEFAEEGRRSLEETLRDTYNIEIIDAPIVDISSTEIREGLAEGRDMSEWLM